MDLTKVTQYEEVQIVVTIDFKVDPFVKVYHEHENI